MNEKPKDVLRPTDDEARRLAETLIRSARYGALAVIDPADGSPAASRVATATDTDGAPVILISALSGHTAGLAASNRCSILLGEPGKGDPLAYPRLTLFCDAVRVEEGSADRERIARRYLNRHPKAKLYAGFSDFAFFRLEPLRASLNGGFGKAFALSKSDLVIEDQAVAEIAASEQSAIDHMNSDHLDAIGIYATKIARAPEGRWMMTGIDPDGFDIASGDDSRRIRFDRRLRGSADLRPALVDLVKRHRQ